MKRFCLAFMFLLALAVPVEAAITTYYIRYDSLSSRNDSTTAIAWIGNDTLVVISNAEERVRIHPNLFKILSDSSVTRLRIDNAATDGDPVMSFSLSDTDKFTIGVDDGDSDKFKIGTTAVGTGTWLTWDGTTFTIAGNIAATDLDGIIGSNTAAAGLFTTLGASDVLSVTDDTEATSTTAASLKTAGGLGVAKKAYIGTDLDVGGDAVIDGASTLTGRTDATYTDTDSLVVNTTATFNGATIANLGTVTTANIDGGSIDGTTIGAASAAAGTFTTLVAAGSVFINDTANTFQTIGQTINQGQNDNEIFALQSAGDVAHGMTTLTETDTYAIFQKEHPDSGGVRIRGYSEGSTPGMVFGGVVTTDDTRKEVIGRGTVDLVGYKKSGTSVGACGADANLVVIRNAGTTRFIFDAEGSAHADVEWTTYDVHDDFGAVHDIEALMCPGVYEKRKYGEKELVDLGIFGEGSVRMEPNGKMRGMLNTTKTIMLHNGTLIKTENHLNALYATTDSLKAQNAAIIAENVSLRAQVAALQSQMADIAQTVQMMRESVPEQKTLTLVVDHTNN